MTTTDCFRLTDNILEVMSKGLVAIHVGSGDSMATFYSSKTYLCDVSRIFHNALMGSFREAAEGVLCLPDDDPVSFRHIPDSQERQSESTPLPHNLQGPEV